MKSKHPESFASIMVSIYNLNTTILRTLEDYQKINDELISEMHNIDFIYMQFILLNMHKIFSDSKNDKTSIRVLKTIDPKKFLSEIIHFEEKYEHVIDKIKSNRHRVIAHIDISSSNAHWLMGLSEHEIAIMRKDIENYCSLIGERVNVKDRMIKDLEKLQSSSAKNERYCPSDFSVDIPSFRSMLKEFLTIIDDMNLHFYKMSF